MARIINTRNLRPPRGRRRILPLSGGLRVRDGNTNEGQSPALELVNTLTAQLAQQVKAAPKAFAGVEPVDFLTYVFAQLQDLLAKTTDPDAKLSIFKEMRHVGEQLTAREVGLQKARPGNRGGVQVNFLRALDKSEQMEVINGNDLLLPEDDDPDETA